MECTNKCQINSCDYISATHNSMLDCRSSCTLEKENKTTYSPKWGVGFGVEIVVFTVALFPSLCTHPN